MQRTTGGSFDPRLAFRKALGTGFLGLFILALLIGMAGLLILIIQVLIEGVPWLSWTLLSSYQSRFPEQAGVLAPLSAACGLWRSRQLSLSPWVSGRRSTWRNTPPGTV